MDALHELAVEDLVGGFGRREFTPVEVVDACLRRIEEVNPVLNLHWFVAAEKARSAAVVAEKRWVRGDARQLEGVPVGIKDVIDVAGMPCTGGSRVYASRKADRSARAVENLEAAGAIVLTKDATTEFATGFPHNALFGAARNPWRTDHWTGGSSAGGAGGVAARTVPMAIGTDVAGSIRIPVSWSGVVGLRPTIGRVSRGGVMPLSWTMETIGPMARTVRDIGLVLTAMSGYDPADPRSVEAPVVPQSAGDIDISGMRVGLPREWYAGVADEAVAGAVEDAAAVMKDAGAHVTELPAPRFAQQAPRIAFHLCFSESAFVMGEHLREGGLADRGTVQRLDQGLLTSAADYFRCLRYRHRAQLELSQLFEDVDVILLPTTPSTAPRLDDLTVTLNGQRQHIHRGQGQWTIPIALTGFPALAVPAGFSDGLPLSVQIVGKPFHEGDCLRTGAAYQDIAGHHRMVPTGHLDLPEGAEIVPTDTIASALGADEQVMERMQQVAGWFGVELTADRLAGISASVGGVEADLRRLREEDHGYLDSGFDPVAGDALLRSFMQR